ncbi:PIN domain-containing protein [Candidatus Methanoperedens nitroreducens]|uniref:PIN domain-containing protein n=1 Tax=Candidatus Methanoperedens nitratireducens TaxID=1392998 RepID=A0A062V6M7_9EURY|nr:PIN domain-containing protein [Candidatus Methanoperedens nitroreducens]KCZ72927.1 PIN domain-containing protein [Candidatus Methanoperedens nitroreducens]MDJ1423145.1 PIN domain-containing protein [Candidatus Methanoperedens sp.]
MITILIDTMHVADILIDDSYFELARAIQNEKMTGLASVITLTELIKIRGMKDKEKMYSDLDRLITSNLVFMDVDSTIAMRAGELRLKYDIPTADSLIVATGIVENVKHILTDDEHFKPLKNIIKPIDLKTALKLVK